MPNFIFNKMKPDSGRPFWSSIGWIFVRLVPMIGLAILTQEYRSEGEVLLTALFSISLSLMLVIRQHDTFEGLMKFILYAIVIAFPIAAITTAFLVKYYQ